LNQNGSRNEANFVLSLTLPLVANLCAGAICLLFALGFFLTGGLNWVGGIFPMFVSLIPFYSFVKYQRTQVKTDSFYEDRFTVSERGLARDYRCGDIQRVESSSTLLAPVVLLRIYLEGRKDPLILPETHARGILGLTYSLGLGAKAWKSPGHPRFHITKKFFHGDSLHLAKTLNYTAYHIQYDTIGSAKMEALETTRRDTRTPRGTSLSRLWVALGA
jgi:hypothetical protein